MAEVWIGTSGYVYRHWRAGVFYPPVLPPREELAWYAGRFRTVELNNPFYRAPSRENFIRWSRAHADGFLFAVKVPRVVSHTRRLRETREPLDRFLEAAASWAPSSGRSWCSSRPNSISTSGTGRLPGDDPAVASLGAGSPAPELAGSGACTSGWPRAAWRCAFRSADASQPDLVTTADFTYIRMHAGEEPGGGFGEDQLCSGLEGSARSRSQGRTCTSTSTTTGRACPAGRRCGCGHSCALSRKAGGPLIPPMSVRRESCSVALQLDLRPTAERPGDLRLPRDARGPVRD